MTAESTLRLLSDIDDELIADAAPKAAHPTPYRAWILAAAACLLLAVGLGLSLWQQGGDTPGLVPPVSEEDPEDSTSMIGDAHPDKNTPESGAVPDKSTAAATTDSTTATTRWPTSNMGVVTTNQSIYIVPRWEEKTITQRFPEAQWQERRYSIHDGSVPADQLEVKLDTLTATGYDTYEDATHTIAVTLYAIRDIATECAVAVQYEGVPGYYPAVCSAYRPETLGQLVDDLNLQEHVAFREVWYDYRDAAGVYHRLRFADIADRVVWELLLDDRGLENVYDQQEMYVDEMSIRVDIPILGYENISLWVTEDGYLCTNILDTGKAFYVGVEKVNAFTDYVLENLDGVELVYDYPDDSTATQERARETVTATSAKSSYRPATTQWQAR